MEKRRKKGCWNCEKKTLICSRIEILKCLKDSKCSMCGWEGYSSKYGHVDGRFCSHCNAEWPIYK